MIRDHTSEGIRCYEAICIVSLTALFMLLLARGLGNLALLPLLIGLGGLVGRGRWGSRPLVLWRTAPFLLVLCVAIFLVRQGLIGPFQGTSPLADVLLALAVLGYVAGHYRLQGLDPSPLPTDPRQLGPAVPTRRAVPATEILALVLEVCVFVALAFLAWDWLPDTWYDYNLNPEIWRTLLLVWLIGMGVLLTASVLNYFAKLLLTGPEAELLLQDVLWKETRREQRRVGRWLAWSRKKK